MISFIGNVKLDRLEYLGKLTGFSKKLFSLEYLTV
jgi:hypothetical protein